MEYTYERFIADIERIAEHIKASYRPEDILGVFGVPRGGTIPAIELSRALGVPFIPSFDESHDDSRNIIVIDDIVDSGRTRMRYKVYPFYALVNKDQGTRQGILPFQYALGTTSEWVHFWWEHEPAIDIKDSIIRQLEYIREDPNREGLRKTPARVERAWQELFKGYQKDPKEIFTTFETDGYSGIVLLKNIEMFSMCEHHILPFAGRAHIAYIPNEKVIGISKLARLLEIYSRRLQIQERICEQITTDLMNYLEPKGAACIIEAEHFCIRMRGVNKQNSTMVTSSLKGMFLDNPGAHNELLQLISRQ